MGTAVVALDYGEFRVAVVTSRPIAGYQTKGWEAHSFVVSAEYGEQYGLLADFEVVGLERKVEAWPTDTTGSHFGLAAEVAIDTAVEDTGLLAGIGNQGYVA